MNDTVTILSHDKSRNGICQKKNYFFNASAEERTARKDSAPDEQQGDGNGMLQVVGNAAQEHIL